jgi:hypothetical protein
VERLLYRLCLSGLADHPDELRERLDSRQIAGWQAYERIEPFTPDHLELLAAIVARTIEANAFGRKSPPRNLEDFMPSKQQGEMTAEEIHATLLGLGE